MDWSRIKAEFEWDGSLRDIYILGTSQVDWDRVVEILRQRDPEPLLSLGDNVGPIPQPFPSFETIFEHGALLRTVVEGMVINCHFFGADEVEFDLDPREVVGPGQVTALEAFMADLGTATGRDVILTHENARTDVICRWRAETGTAIWAACR